MTAVPRVTVVLDAAGDPCTPCLGCGSREFWRPAHTIRPGSAWRCLACEPAKPIWPRDACCLPAEAA